MHTRMCASETRQVKVRTRLGITPGERHRSTWTSGWRALPFGTVGPGPSQGSRQLRGTGREHITPTSCVGYMHTRVSWPRQVKYARQADIAALELFDETCQSDVPINVHERPAAVEAR
jgi:hypothetical protein